ncbi:hypothetical protein V7138_22510 [Bacillus sp. JJ1533]|uniref:hypothetical protein n=1 Tax=Bacillus sp. JJ1533 TaxID=3122959 RepID=UPI003000FA1C
MKYAEKDFTFDLKERIVINEATLKDLIGKLRDENKPIFAKKGLDFDAGFERMGNDPFLPGYSSSISIGISDESGELIDLHIIKIWECGRYFLGIPVSQKIPGSKIVGELLDDSLENIKSELNEYIEDHLSLTED